MQLNMLLQTVRAEIASAEDRAAAHARNVTALLASGHDSMQAEQALFAEMDGLALLRARLSTINALSDQAVAA